MAPPPAARLAHRRRATAGAKRSHRSPIASPVSCSRFRPTWIRAIATASRSCASARGRFERDMTVRNVRSGKDVRLTRAMKPVRERPRGRRRGVRRRRRGPRQSGDVRDRRHALRRRPGCATTESRRSHPNTSRSCATSTRRATSRFRRGSRSCARRARSKSSTRPTRRGSEPICAAVGPLQFEVTKYRLAERVQRQDGTDRPALHAGDAGRGRPGRRSRAPPGRRTRGSSATGTIVRLRSSRASGACVSRRNGIQDLILYPFGELAATEEPRVKKLTLFVAVSALAGCFGENHYEQTADSVTKAIMANDMRPVESDFNAIVRPKLLNRAHVGELSDQLNALGPLQAHPRDDRQRRPAGRAHLRRRLRQGDLERDHDDRQRREDRRRSTSTRRARTRPERSERGRRDRHVRGRRRRGAAAARRRQSHAGRHLAHARRAHAARRSRSSARTCSGWAPSSFAAPTIGSRNSMPPSARAGVVAFSSGNHAQGVALAASLLGIRATIVMPHDAPRAKVAATRGYGAEIVVYERGREDRAAVAARVARERGGTIVPPFDDPAIVAGQGTVALELLEDVPDLDVTRRAARRRRTARRLRARGPRARLARRVVGRRAGDGRRLSRARSRPARAGRDRGAGRRSPTACRRSRPARSPFRSSRRECAGVVTVSDEELRAAMRFAFERLKLVVEPSGAAPLAALLTGKIDRHRQARRRDRQRRQRRRRDLRERA